MQPAPRGQPRNWDDTPLEMPQLVLAKDWSKTTLGPAENWSASLRMALDIILSSAFPMALRWGPDFILIYNDGYKPILGQKHPWALGLPAREAWSEVWSVIEPMHQAILKGQSRGIFAEDMLLRIQRHGTQWDDARFTLSYSPVHDDSAPNGIGGIFVTAVETTDRVKAEADLRTGEEALRTKSRALEILNRTGAALAAEHDRERVVQMVTDAGVELTGAQFGAFFYNVLDEAGESYMLYSLSGVPREEFSKFPMPRNTAVFAPTFSGESILRSDDITKDPRYGHNAPRRGMPEGHLPVRSYLAIPVTSRSGEVLGGLFFGHAEVAVFGSSAEESMMGLAALAAIAIDNARLHEATQREIDQRTKAEVELLAINNTLEERVTAEIERRAKAEDALRQSQKMEAVGQLTGGVAHDFNNLLTVILGGLDTIRRSRPDETARIRRSADMAYQGAQRAASLTARLLAFSRRQPLAPKPLELNHLVRDMTELLHRTLGESIELEGVLAPRLWLAEIDRNQLESAIINLAVNSRDAMPNGGKLTIETSNTALDEAYVARDSEVIPGQYVMLSVSDNGSGMSKAVSAKAFEPFFTTKVEGKGTGLGLSMVYGFVKQSGGHVTIYSEEGQGTTIKLYFPKYLGGHATEDAAEPLAPTGRGDEIVLVVEDNEDVRSYSVMILSELGYSVLEAKDAASASAILNGPQPIDLLFTDVVLPDSNGRLLADAAMASRPGLPVLFTTGYSRNAIVHQGRLDAGVNLISKPFTFEQLAERVRHALDSAKVIKTTDRK